jgi:hypothetical protein
MGGRGNSAAYIETGIRASQRTIRSSWGFLFFVLGEHEHDHKEA